MNIVLTGFMCAGKTTIGRKVAKLMNYNFIDTDIEIEEDQGCSVEDIFKYGGEECFRDMETKILEKLKILTISKNLKIFSMKRKIWSFLGIRLWEKS